MNKVGLALEGGGLKGSYQVGAYYAFKKCHIKISGVVGTSIGSFNACLIAAHQEEELLKMWENLKPEELLDIDLELVKYINGKEKIVNGLLGFNKTWFSILKTKGIKMDKLKALADNLVNLDKLYKSNIDFGLVTVRLHDLKPFYLYKENINKDDLTNYLIASCSLPIFHLKPIIDKHIYIDGGFYDNCPISMLIDKGYDTIYEIRIHGIGRNRKVNHKNTNVITIESSRDLCHIIEVNHSKIRENILLGYYDTLRVLKNYLGYKYTFKRLPNFIVKLLYRKVSYKEYNRIKNFFNTNNYLDTLVKSLEYCLEKENVTYYKVYNIIERIYYIKRIDNKNFVYQFIKKLKIIL